MTRPRTGYTRIEPASSLNMNPVEPEPENEPTLEQLERTALLLGFPLLPEGLRPPYYEESLRNLHRLVQQSIDGDEQASHTLALLKARFGA
jgi:hypothetical protein